MREIGIVESVEGNFAVVRIKRHSACGENCADCKGGCTRTEQTVSALNNVGAKAGDNVAVQMQTSYVLLAAFLVYILPLITLFAVYAVMYALLKNDGISILAGILAMLLTFYAVKKSDKRMRDKYVPIIAYVL